jgi:hypothetical protein
MNPKKKKSAGMLPQQPREATYLTMEFVQKLTLLKTLVVDQEGKMKNGK